MYKMIPCALLRKCLTGSGKAPPALFQQATLKIRALETLAEREVLDKIVLVLQYLFTWSGRWLGPKQATPAANSVCILIDFA
jgi:hypothetical protein